jgi:hypothetical protein
MEMCSMSTRRMSFGLLVTLAAGAIAIGCGGSTPEATAPPQPAVTAEAPAPPPTIVAEAPKPAPAVAPEPPKPAPKASKEKWVGKFTEDFSGDVLSSAEADAKKKAGKKDPENKKYGAEMDRAKASVADNIVENTADTLTWSVKGKASHTMKYEIVKGDDPSNLAIRFVKDGSKDLKKPIEVSVTFTGDDTFSFKDPFARKPDAAPTLVFKRQ